MVFYALLLSANKLHICHRMKEQKVISEKERKKNNRICPPCYLHKLPEFRHSHKYLGLVVLIFCPKLQDQCVLLRAHTDGQTSPCFAKVTRSIIIHQECSPILLYYQKWIMKEHVHEDIGSLLPGFGKCQPTIFSRKTCLHACRSQS